VLTRHKYHHQEHGKLADLSEQVEGEKGVLRQGKVVGEAGNERTQSHHDRGDGRGRLPWVIRCPRPGQAHKENGQAGRVQQKPHVVDLLDLLPAGLFKVVGRARWGPVEQQRPDHAQHAVDDPNVVAPAPARGGVRVQRGCDQCARGRPGDGHGALGEAQETSPFVGDQFLDAGVRHKDDATPEADDGRSRDQGEGCLSRCSHNLFGHGQSRLSPF
jgi:hypothetical protein